VRTQLPYSLFVAGLALICGYVPSASGLSWCWSIGAAILIMVGFFIVLARWEKTSVAQMS